MLEGIAVIEVEESYTSKCSFIDNETIEKHETYVGNRVKRGLFQNSKSLINADVNGAVGILRKVNALSDADLISLRDRGDVVSPLVLKYKP